MWPLTRKRTLTASRFRTEIRSQAVSHPFRKKLHPFERLGRSVWKGSQAVRTAVSSVHKNCPTVRTASVPVRKNLHPFERFGHPFTKIIYPFERLVPSVQKNCLSVQTAVAPVQKNLNPFERLGHPFRKIIHPFKTSISRNRSFKRLGS